MSPLFKTIAQRPNNNSVAQLLGYWEAVVFSVTDREWKFLQGKSDSVSVTQLRKLEKSLLDYVSSSKPP